MCEGKGAKASNQRYFRHRCPQSHCPHLRWPGSTCPWHCTHIQAFNVSTLANYQRNRNSTTTIKLCRSIFFTSLLYYDYSSLLSSYSYYPHVPTISETKIQGNYRDSQLSHDWNILYDQTLHHCAITSV